MIPVGICMFKVNNGNTRTRCEICSKLTIKTPERRQRRGSGVFINFEHISQLVLLFLLLTLRKRSFRIGLFWFLVFRFFTYSKSKRSSIWFLSRKFSKNYYFLPPHTYTYVCVSRGKKC